MFLGLPMIRHWGGVGPTNFNDSLTKSFHSKVFSYKNNITCRYTKKNLGATDYGFVDIYPSGDEQALKAAVATVGNILLNFSKNQNFTK